MFWSLLPRMDFLFPELVIQCIGLKPTLLTRYNNPPQKKKKIYIFYTFGGFFPFCYTCGVHGPFQKKNRNMLYYYKIIDHFRIILSTCFLLSTTGFVFLFGTHGWL